jgi:hypothetical protein
MRRPWTPLWTRWVRWGAGWGRRQPGARSTGDGALAGGQARHGFVLCRHVTASLGRCRWPRQHRIERCQQARATSLLLPALSAAHAPSLPQTFSEMDLTRDGVINPEEWMTLVHRNPGGQPRRPWRQRCGSRAHKPPPRGCCCLACPAAPHPGLPGLHPPPPRRHHLLHDPAGAQRSVPALPHPLQRAAAQAAARAVTPAATQQRLAALAAQRPAGALTPWPLPTSHCSLVHLACGFRCAAPHPSIPRSPTLQAPIASLCLDDCTMPLDLLFSMKLF